MITAAIGDIHGMQDHLARLLREIAAYAESQGWPEPPRLVFLGDYVDRGPASRAVGGCCAICKARAPSVCAAITRR